MTNGALSSAAGIIAVAFSVNHPGLMTRLAVPMIVQVYDPDDDRWHNVVMDTDESGVWIGGNPLIVCDVADHAYATDYKRREDYVVKFLDHIDWEVVAQRYRRVDRM